MQTDCKVQPHLHTGVSSYRLNKWYWNDFIICSCDSSKQGIEEKCLTLIPVCFEIKNTQ